MRIVLVTHSTHVGQPQLEVMAKACAAQLRKHAAPVWRRPHAAVVAAPPAPGDWLVHFFDDSDQAGALGYHDETPDGLPYSRIFVKPVLDAGGSIYEPADGANTVSAVCSHEVLEMWGDPWCNMWAQAPDGALWALELADQVEGDAYTIRVGGKYGQDVPVSNFLGPNAFDAHAGVGDELDFMGTLPAPFTCAPNGYAIKMTEGKVSTIWGDLGPVGWKRLTKLHPAARTYRRGARPVQP